MNVEHAPSARAEMLIRRPADQVFEAFVDPAITCRFWFTKGSGRLEPGKRVTWEWEMYGMSVDVAVKQIEPHRRILVDWSAYGTVDTPTTVEWHFTPRGNDATFVSVTNSGFRGHGAELLSQALSSTEGFALVLAGLKAWLEHGIELNLVRDRHPDQVRAG